MRRYFCLSLLLAVGAGLWGQTQAPIDSPTFTGPATFTGTVKIGNTVAPASNSLAAWGDSLTYGQNGNTNVGDWPALFSGLTGYQTYNAGFPGYGSSSIAAQYLADSSHASWCTVFEAGISDAPTYSGTVSNIASMWAYQPDNGCRAVLSVMPNTVYVAGSATYLAAQAVNFALSATYGNKYIDVWTPLINGYNAGNLLDVLDHSNGITPSTLRAQVVTTTLGALGSSGCTFTFAGSLAPGANTEAMIDSEYIYITAISGQNVTACTRGYASSTAVSHSSGATMTIYDQIHLNASGYQIWADAVFAWLTTYTPNYVTGTQALGPFLTTAMQAIPLSQLTLTKGNSIVVGEDGSLNIKSPLAWVNLQGQQVLFLSPAFVPYGSVSRAGDGTMYFQPISNARFSTPLFLNGGAVATGSRPTVTGCGTISNQRGGSTAGTFQTDATSCTPVLTSLPSVNNGYACLLWDMSHYTSPQGAVSSTGNSATFGTLTTTAGDVIAYNCGLAY